MEIEEYINELYEKHFGKNESEDKDNDTKRIIRSV